MSLPQRRYDLAGRLLSSALEHAERSGDSPRTTLNQRAYQLGEALGEAARSAAGDRDTRDTALQVLEAHSFEPRLEGGIEGGDVTLAHTGLTAHPDPAPPHCCVRLQPTDPESAAQRH